MERRGSRRENGCLVGSRQGQAVECRSSTRNGWHSQLNKQVEYPVFLFPKHTVVCAPRRHCRCCRPPHARFDGRFAHCFARCARQSQDGGHGTARYHHHEHQHHRSDARWEMQCRRQVSGRWNRTLTVPAGRPSQRGVAAAEKGSPEPADRPNRPSVNLPSGTPARQVIFFRSEGPRYGRFKGHPSWRPTALPTAATQRRGWSFQRGWIEKETKNKKRQPWGGLARLVSCTHRVGQVKFSGAQRPSKRPAALGRRRLISAVWPRTGSPSFSSLKATICDSLLSVAMTTVRSVQSCEMNAITEPELLCACDAIQRVVCIAVLFQPWNVGWLIR